MHVEPWGPTDDPHDPSDQCGHSLHPPLFQEQIPGELPCEPKDNGFGVWGLAAGGHEEVAYGQVDGGTDAAGGPQVCTSDGEADAERVQCSWTDVLGGYYFYECWDSVCWELLRHDALLFGQVSVGKDDIIVKFWFQCKELVHRRLHCLWFLELC